MRVFTALLMLAAFELWPDAVSAQWWWGDPWYQPPPRYRQTPTPTQRRSTPRKQKTEKKTRDTERETTRPLDSANPYYNRKQRPSAGETLPTAPARESSAAAATPMPLPSAGGFSTIIYGGESLSDLGRATGASARDILEANALTSDQLREGQALRVPTPREPMRMFDPARQIEREVWRGLRGRKQVALTFDAGGETRGASELIQYLTEVDAAATFFVTGEFADKNRELVRDIVQAGFPIHNHSYTHPEFTQISEELMADELARTDEVVKEVTGKSTRPYFRPPFGDRDRRVLRTAAAQGYQSVYWTIDSLDSVGDRKSADEVVQRVLDPPKARGDVNRYLDGAIILMHVGEPETAAAVPIIVRELRRRGFTLVTVEQILAP